VCIKTRLSRVHYARLCSRKDVLVVRSQGFLQPVPGDCLFRQLEKMSGPFDKVVRIDDRVVGAFTPV
jgi:hypothetical protein